MNRKTALILIFLLIIFSCNDDNGKEYRPAPIDISERLYAGGGTTVFSATSIAFETPAPNLSATNLAIHLDGDAEFEAAFITAPANINSGVGPIFNNNSCVACHPRDGRSAFPSDDINALSGFFLRGSIPGVGEHGGINPIPGFGGQLQNQAIFGRDAEVKFKVVYKEIVEILADGTKVILRKPTYSILESYITFPSDAILSPRLAPPVFGLGLLEAITEEDILTNQDINDLDGDGISGKANYVWDPFLKKTVIGRFGWKANASTVFIQSAAAYVEDMGITNYVFPNESGINQANGQDGLNDDPEITDDILDQVVLYCRTLGVPAPRGIETNAVKTGAAIFENIDCAKCHIPKQKSGNFPGIDAISNQTFFPYTDMLLHDMGEGLADGRPDFLANGNEWKTRPLWGIGMTNLINGHTDFLHDGRAKNITEAILWHGGEAENAKNNFKALSTEEREALLVFLNSL